MESVGTLGAQRRRVLTWRWPACFLLWLTPSIAQLTKFVAWPNSLLVIAAAGIGIGVLLAWAPTPRDGRAANEPPWHLLIGVALCLLFAIAYPAATSGLFGRGSDRADAINVADAALLAGRQLYDPLTYLGNPPTPLPGAAFLGLPFHLLGSAALQNVFWFLLFCALAPRLVGDKRGGAAYLVMFVLCCPGVVLDFATGSDFATNVIYVIVAAWLMTRLRPQETWAVRLLACLFFAVALSSRPIYAVEAPIVAGAMLQSQGLRRTAEAMACVAVLLAIINAPAWADDPSRFPLMLHARYLRIYPAWLHAEVTIPALSIAIACCAFFVRMERGRIWLLTAISLAPMLLPNFLFSAVRGVPLRKLVVMDSYTLPLALFAGLWLLRLPSSTASSAPDRLGAVAPSLP